MDRPWAVICGDLDRATGRRFPPVGGRGRGFRLDTGPQQMTPAEVIARVGYAAWGLRQALDGVTLSAPTERRG